MIQFRLRDLFAILLVVVLVLVWTLQPSNGISARILLDARKISNSLAAPISTVDSRPATDDELIKSLGLQAWAKIPEWIGSPYSYSRGLDIVVEVPWLDTPVSFYWTSDIDEPNRAFRVVWQADWDAIEKQERLERRQLAVRGILTGIALLYMAWLYRPRNKHRPGDKQPAMDAR